MADKKVKIQIDTTANTKGAQDASKALDKVVQSEKEVAKSASQAQTNTDALERELTAVSDKARVSEFAFYDLDASIAKTGNTSQAVANGGIKAVGNGFKNVGSTIGQVGFQVQDFAVQVGGGTSALTAFAQQGSQLLGIFGPGGAVAGALLAIGAIGVRVFSEMGEKAATMTQDIETAAQNAAANAADSFQESLTAIDQSIEQAAALSQGYEQTKESASRYAASSIENSVKIRQAEQLIAEELGIQINLRAQLAAQLEAEAAKRAIQTQAEIDAQNKRLDAEKQELARLQEKAGRFDQLRTDTLFELTQQNARLEGLRAERRELEALAKFDFSQLNPESPQSVVDQANAALSARRTLADPVATEARNLQIAGLEAVIPQIQSDLRGLEGSIVGIGTAITAANTRIEDTTGSVSTEIARIEESASATDLLAKAQSAVAVTDQINDQGIAGLQEILAQAVPVTEAQKLAKERISEAIKDGEISSNEASLIAGQLANLMGAISATNQQSLTQVTQLITLMGILRQNQVETDRKLQDLQRQIGKTTTN